LTFCYFCVKTKVKEQTFEKQSGQPRGRAPTENPYIHIPKNALNALTIAIFERIIKRNTKKFAW
jgi:hypothetical protein